MPASTIDSLRLFQWGKESTRGTAVAATSKVAVEEIAFEEDDQVYRPRLAKGLLHRNPGSETVVQRGTSWKVPKTPVIYDQLQHWLSMAVKGGVTATGVDPYTWTFARSLTADPAPDSWTLERRLSDGTDSIDYEWAYALLSKLQITYEVDKALMLSAEGFARRVQASTLTGALTMPTIEIPPGALAKIWIDATWANLGTTQITGQVLQADVTFLTGLAPLMAFDGRADLDFSSYVLNPAGVGLDVEITMLVKASSGQFATEKTAAEAGTLRAVRLEVLGTQSRELELDMLLKHEKGSLFAVKAQDGQDIVTLKLTDSDDGTNMFQAKVVNKTNVYT